MKIPIEIDIIWNEAYIYGKQNMSIQKNINCDINWKYDMNQVYNSLGSTLFMHMIKDI